MSRGQVHKLTTQKGHSHNEPSYKITRRVPGADQLPQGPRLADRHDLHLPAQRLAGGSEIERLTALKARRGRYLETPRQELDQAELPYATEQKPGEIIGYGATARRSEPAPPVSAPAPRRAEAEPFELGRYTTPQVNSGRCTASA